jgi:hypothetical protein
MSGVENSSGMRGSIIAGVGGMAGALTLPAQQTRILIEEQL